jgi:hypothetical protein
LEALQNSSRKTPPQKGRKLHSSSSLFIILRSAGLGPGSPLGQAMAFRAGRREWLIGEYFRKYLLKDFLKKCRLHLNNVKISPFGKGGKGELSRGTRVRNPPAPLFKGGLKITGSEFLQHEWKGLWGVRQHFMGNIWAPLQYSRQQKSRCYCLPYCAQAGEGKVCFHF